MLNNVECLVSNFYLQHDGEKSSKKFICVLCVKHENDKNVEKSCLREIAWSIDNTPDEAQAPSTFPITSFWLSLLLYNKLFVKREIVFSDCVWVSPTPL
jgi:hypothetical protein